MSGASLPVDTEMEVRKLISCENCIWNDDCGSDDVKKCKFYTPWNDEEEEADTDREQRMFRRMWWIYLDDRG